MLRVLFPFGNRYILRLIVSALLETIEIMAVFPVAGIHTDGRLNSEICGGIECQKPILRVGLLPHADNPTFARLLRQAR
jgi:hypothetical protein